MPELTEDKDFVRLLISDVGGEDGDSFIFSDDEINAFLSLETNSRYRAAAAALRTMASNEVMVQKRITFLELKTDGPLEADALRKLATEYDKRADEVGDDESGVVIVEIIADHFGARSKVLRQRVSDG